MVPSCQHAPLRTVEFKPVSRTRIWDIEENVHDPARAILELDQDDGGVFAAVVLNEIRNAATQPHNAAEEHFQEVQAMRAEVHQRAAAARGRVLTPCARDWRVPAGQLRASEHRGAEPA